jgi:hypothetical protein
MPRHRVSFFLDDHLAQGLKRLKDRDGTPVAEAMRRAIAEFLERRGVNKKSARRPAETDRRA